VDSNRFRENSKHWGKSGQTRKPKGRIRAKEVDADFPNTTPKRCPMLRKHRNEKQLFSGKRNQSREIDRKEEFCYSASLKKGNDMETIYTRE